MCCNKTNVFDDEDLEKWWDEEESDNNGLTIVVAYVADLEWIKQKRVPRGSIPDRRVVPRDLRGGNLRMVVDYSLILPFSMTGSFEESFRSPRICTCALWYKWRHISTFRIYKHPL